MIRYLFCIGIFTTVALATSYADRGYHRISLLCWIAASLEFSAAWIVAGNQSRGPR